MQKIVLAVNAENMSTRAIDFAAYVAGLTQSRLTCFFLRHMLPEPVTIFMTPVAPGYPEAVETAAGENYISPELQLSIDIFKNCCIKRDILFDVQILPGNEMEIMTLESRFADVIIVSAGTSLQHNNDAGAPSKFVTELLANSECPVIVSPETFDEVDEIILAYENTRSCMHAIKQFTYLFPQLNETKLTLLHVSKDKEDKEKKRKLLGWLNTHYSEVNDESVIGEPADELFNKLLPKRNKFVVMGSFGRSLMSMSLRPSTASLLLKAVNLPVFISHT